MKYKQKTLIILAPGFAASESDSTCLPLLQTILKSLKETFSELNIVVLAFQYPHRKGSYMWKGIEVISFDGRNRKKLYKPILWRRILNKLQQLNRDNNIIGLLSLWCHECAWVGKKFSKKNKLKHYCWIWGQDARQGNKYIKRIQPSEKELIALSDFLQSEFEKNYSVRPAYLIPPGIDGGLFQEENTSRSIEVLGAGSLIPLKRYDIFLDTVKELKKNFPNIKAILCGKGPDENKIRYLIDQYQLHENISLIGEVPHQEVLWLMQHSKILLHPSSYEGFSGVCQEALFAGAHVISFCRAMNRKINHWHIVNNAEEMKAKAIELLTSPINYDPIEVNPISNSVRLVMKLFDYNEVITP